MLWTQESLLNQLAIANESMGGGIVVVMAERDKEEMESDIAKMNLTSDKHLSYAEVEAL